MVHKGTVIAEILGFTLSLLSTQCKVDGMVALDDFEKKAVIRAGNIPLKVAIGDIPFAFKNKGSITTA